MFFFFSQGVQTATNIRDDERGGRAHVKFVEGNTSQYDEIITNALGPPAGIKDAAEAEEDEAFSRKHASNTKLYR